MSQRENLTSKQGRDDSLPAVLRRRYKALREDGYNHEFCNVFKRAADALERAADEPGACPASDDGLHECKECDRKWGAEVHAANCAKWDYSGRVSAFLRPNVQCTCLQGLLAEAKQRAESDLLAVGHGTDGEARTASMIDLRDWIKRLEGAAQPPPGVMELLRIARCPNRGCDNKGTITCRDQTGPYPEQCQWCSERDALLRPETKPAIPPVVRDFCPHCSRGVLHDGKCDRCSYVAPVEPRAAYAVCGLHVDQWQADCNACKSAQAERAGATVPLKAPTANFAEEAHEVIADVLFDKGGGDSDEDRLLAKAIVQALVDENLLVGGASPLPSARLARAEALMQEIQDEISFDDNKCPMLGDDVFEFLQRKDGDVQPPSAGLVELRDYLAKELRDTRGVHQGYIDLAELVHDRIVRIIASGATVPPSAALVDAFREGAHYGDSDDYDPLDLAEEAKAYAMSVETKSAVAPILDPNVRVTNCLWCEAVIVPSSAARTCCTTGRNHDLASGMPAVEKPAGPGARSIDGRVV